MNAPDVIVLLTSTKLFLAKNDQFCLVSNLKSCAEQKPRKLKDDI